jgi:hypothetical protein
VVRTQRGGTVPAHAVEVPPRLVTVLQLVGDVPEVEGQPEHHRVPLTARELAGGQRVLEQRSGLGQFAQLAVQRREHPGGGQHLGMVGADLVACRRQRVGQARGGRAGVLPARWPGRMGDDCGEVVDNRHLDMLPARNHPRHPSGAIVSTR